MNAHELKEKSAEELKAELLDLLRLIRSSFDITKDRYELTIGHQRIQNKDFFSALEIAKRPQSKGYSLVLLSILRQKHFNQSPQCQEAETNAKNAEAEEERRRKEEEEV